MSTKSIGTPHADTPPGGHGRGTHGNVGAHGDIAPAEIAIGVIIGRTSEFFDFFVYAIASVLVFPTMIFPYVDRLTGTLYSFGLFALAFVARPIGSLAFMTIDRLYGRGTKLTIAIFMLGGATAAVAFLRICQGLALGGSWDGLSSLLALNAPQDKRGWYAMIPQLGAPLGLIVASGLFAYFLSTLSMADFLDWGWRYPFFVAFALNVVALFARLRIVVTPEYEQAFQTLELQHTGVGGQAHQRVCLDRNRLRHGPGTAQSRHYPGGHQQSITHVEPPQNDDRKIADEKYRTPESAPGHATVAHARASYR